MKKSFQARETNRPLRNAEKLNLKIPNVNQVTFGLNILKNFCRKLRNSFPYHLRTSENQNTFKGIIKSWNGVSCSCCI